MLFAKECKKVAKSLTFWIYCAISLLFFLTQYYSDCAERVYPPSQGGTDFGYKLEENHDVIMEEAVNSLVCEYAANKYVCYPFGFYKSVRLRENKQEKVAEYLRELTGTDEKGLEELLGKGEVYFEGYSTEPLYDFSDIPVSESMTYEHFTEIMDDIDHILGGGSQYKAENLVYSFSYVPMTYEEAYAEYEGFLKEDRITGGLARLFSDYGGIMLGVLPVFVAASFTAADRRRRMSELVYTRDISSAKLVLTRYGALVLTMSIPVLVTMVTALIQALVVYSGESLDIFAYFKLPTVWLLPILMFTTAVGMLLTEMFSATAAVFAQVVYWFYSVMAGGAALSGQIGRFTFICRHNSAMDRGDFLADQDNFIFSRIFFTVLALAAAALTAYVYDLKRGGRFNGIRLFGEGGILRRKA